jgi:hypothetical protein
MQLDFEPETGEVVVAVMVRTTEGKLEVREVPISVRAGIAPLSGELGPGPRMFILEWVRVLLSGYVEIHRGELEESLAPESCVVPLNWPRDVPTAALVYIGPAGSLVLEEPRCIACKGKGTSPFAPPGFTGGTCAICDGSGEYTVAVKPSADDAPLPEEGR